MSDKKQFQIVDLTKGAVFIALMAIGANLAAFIPLGPVPLTFQTVVAILAGILLGKKLGAFSMIGYLLVGFIGVPVLAGFSGGFHVIASPTLGFLISFVVLAFAAGAIIEKSPRPTLLTFFMASYAGLIINYLIGVPYLYFHSNFILGLDGVQLLPIAAGMTPFFIKDLVLATFTAILAPQLLKAVNRQPHQMKAAS
ncbi:biotin transporter BioY [Salipaludibacillus sp. CUR1]|uniref:biotin transporter BioY n=1 Tax=Salipaludibacillus sp. CUR1 TaxID=2820003 RepID=UPI001E41676B|nr:biotin transporter BioY [Salipaludibacillus sp. CUR1]MCE7793013.1 biotin transporter BioY [Salipaludibacillus sp. CUR1]